MQTRWNSRGETDSGHPGCWVWGFKRRSTSRSRTPGWEREFLETACASRVGWQPSRHFWGLQFGFLFLYQFVSLVLSELPRYHKNFKCGEFRYTSQVQDVGMPRTLSSASYQGKAGCTRALLSHTDTYLSRAPASTEKKLGKWADWAQKQTSAQPKWQGNHISRVHCRTPPEVSISARPTAPGPQLQNFRPGHQLDATSSLQIKNSGLQIFLENKSAFTSGSQNMEPPVVHKATRNGRCLGSSHIKL